MNLLSKREGVVKGVFRNNHAVIAGYFIFDSTSYQDPADGCHLPFHESAVFSRRWPDLAFLEVSVQEIVVFFFCVNGAFIIDDQFAVEMVYLMLDDPGNEARITFINLPA